MRLGAGAYICGEETSLLESLEGKHGVIRFKPPLPAIDGLFGKPTVVNNVLSLATVPTSCTRARSSTRDFGMGRSRGTMPFQLAGNIKHGGLVEKAFGLTLREAIYDFGGGTATGRPLRAVQVGGPLGAYFPESLLDTPLDYEALAAQKGCSATAASSCSTTRSTCEAGPLRHGVLRRESLRQVHAVPHRLHPRRRGHRQDHRRRPDREQNLELLDDLCEMMLDGILCALGGLRRIRCRARYSHFPATSTRNREEGQRP